MEGTWDFSFQLLRMAGSLLLVLAILFACLYALKRWGQWGTAPDAAAWIRVLARQSLGPKHYLLVVRVREQVLLLGVSPEGIRLLTRIEEGRTDDPETPQARRSSVLPS